MVGKFVAPLVRQLRIAVFPLLAAVLRVLEIPVVCRYAKFNQYLNFVAPLVRLISALYLAVKTLGSAERIGKKTIDIFRGLFSNSNGKKGVKVATSAYCAPIMDGLAVHPYGDL